MTFLTTNQKSYSDETLRELFIGRRITVCTYEVPGNVLFELDNGVRLRLVPNEECSPSCGNGIFTLTDFSKFDHVITRVEVTDDKKDLYGDSAQAMLELFVYGEGLSEKVAEVKGTTGNGYPSSLLTIQVLRKL